MNPAKAAREVLLPLMGGDAAAVDNYLQLRRQAAQGIAPPPLPPVPGMSFGGSSDVAYTVQAIADIQDQQGAGVLATIRRGPSQDGSPFTTLRWKATVQPAKSKPQYSAPAPQLQAPAN